MIQDFQSLLLYFTLNHLHCLHFLKHLKGLILQFLCIQNSHQMLVGTLQMGKLQVWALVNKIYFLDSFMSKNQIVTDFTLMSMEKHTRNIKYKQQDWGIPFKGCIDFGRRLLKKALIPFQFHPVSGTIKATNWGKKSVQASRLKSQDVPGVVSGFGLFPLGAGMR